MRRRAPVIAALLASLLATSTAAVAATAPAAAAQSKAPQAGQSAGDPSVSVYASGGGVVTDDGELTISIVVQNPSTQAIPAGDATVAVTERPFGSRNELSAFEQEPEQTRQHVVSTAPTAAVPAGGTVTVATIAVPAASAGLSSSHPGVFGLTAAVTSRAGALPAGAGTLVVPGTTPASVGVAAVMPITVPARSDGLITAQDLAGYTAANGVLTRELMIAEFNPALALAIDPMILASIRVLGRSAPASAQNWLSLLQQVSSTNETFPLQYGDADLGLEAQAGLETPLAPLDFAYAMSAGDFSTPLTVGEPTPTATGPTPTPTPTATPGPQLPTLSELVDWPYSLGGIAWPAPGTVRAADLAAFGRAGMPTTIVSGSNTNALSLDETPDAVLPVSGGTALVTDDGLSQALQAAASAATPAQLGATSAALTAQLALAAQDARSGGVVLVSLGRFLPTDATRASSAVTTVLNSDFSRPSTLRGALTAPPTTGLELADKSDPEERVDAAGRLLDREGDARKGGTATGDTVTAFSSVLVTPTLLTGDVRARVLSLLSVGWSGSSEWSGAVGKELDTMASTIGAVQIVAPGPIRQASHQALIPITVTNKLAYSVAVVLRATPSSARLEVDSDTEKTIPAGSSAKILVPVKAQLSNGSVWLGMQLYSESGVRIGDPSGATIEVHADWEGIGALVFGLVIVAFFSFGLLRTIQRRRREKAAGTADDPSGPEAGGPGPAGPDPGGPDTGGPGTGGPGTGSPAERTGRG